MTGYTRNGCCDDGPDDPNPHTVCAIVTKEFIAFQDGIGNNLSVAEPDKRFPGLVPGNRWCVLTAKWYEAYQNGVACPVVLSATNKAALDMLGATPERAMHVGDLRRTDVAGAAALGMRTARYRRLNDDVASDGPEADFVIEGHRELLRLLDGDALT